MMTTCFSPRTSYFIWCSNQLLSCVHARSSSLAGMFPATAAPYARSQFCDSVFQSLRSLLNKQDLYDSLFKSRVVLCCRNNRISDLLFKSSQVAITENIPGRGSPQLPAGNFRPDDRALRYAAYRLPHCCRGTGSRYVEPGCAQF